MKTDKCLIFRGDFSHMKYSGYSSESSNKKQSWESTESKSTSKKSKSRQVREESLIKLDNDDSASNWNKAEDDAWEILKN